MATNLLELCVLAIKTAEVAQAVPMDDRLGVQSQLFVALRGGSKEVRSTAIAQLRAMAVEAAKKPSPVAVTSTADERESCTSC